MSILNIYLIGAAVYCVGYLLLKWDGGLHHLEIIAWIFGTPLWFIAVPTFTVFFVYRKTPYHKRRYLQRYKSK